MQTFQNVMGPLPKATLLRKALSLEEHDAFFKLLPDPKPMQTVQDFITHQQQKARQMDEKSVIRIVPIGNVPDELESLVLPFLKAYLAHEQIEWTVIPALTSARMRILGQGVDANHCKAKDGTQIAELMQRAVQDRSWMIVGLTLEKIGARDESNAFRISDTIAHDGQVPARLLTLIWNEKAKYNCMQLVANQVLDMLGVAPCTMFECLMNKNCMALGPICLRKLSIVNPKLNALARYQNILRVIATLDSSDVRRFAEWCNERVVALGGQLVELDRPEVCSMDKSKLQLLKRRMKK